MDNVKKQDARVVKTRRDLRAALMQMMEKTDFDKIGVSEICKTAMVNRMTFYKHYNDKYDLLNDVVLELKRNILRRMNVTDPQSEVGNDTAEFIFRLLEAVVDECLERRVFLFSLNNDVVLTMISTTLERSMTELLIEIDRKHRLRYPIDKISAAVTGAASFLVRQWLVQQPEKTKQVFLTGTKQFFKDLFDSKILFS